MEYNYRDKTYSVVPCTKKDIPSHIERVLSYWKSTGTDLVKRQATLEACVDNGTTLQVLNKNNKCCGCIYWDELDDTTILVYFVWFKNGIILTIGLDYLYHFTRYKTVCYIPHQRTKISYKSLLTNLNAMMFFNTDKPIQVNIRNPNIRKWYTRYSKHLTRI